ncbi:MAG: hypothetical protein P8Z42_14150, partial [Anaerolineales bacterium]
MVFSHPRRYLLLTITSMVVILSVLVGCGPSRAELDAVDYAPTSRDLWPVSTPEEQGLDPDLVAELYYNASQSGTVYSLLVFKNGYLIAEDYSIIGSPDLQLNIHSGFSGLGVDGTEDESDQFVEQQAVHLKERACRHS